MKLKNGSHRNIYFRAISNARHKSVSTAIVDEKDRNLSYKDVGIYYFVMTRGEGWQLHLRDLATRKMEGVGAIIAAMRRLRKTGWCRLVQVRKLGRIAAYRYDFFDEPLREPQRDVVIENYDGRGKLVSTAEKRFGTRRWQQKTKSPHTQKSICGPHTTFPHSGKHVCGNARGTNKQNNGLPAEKNGTIGSSISISLSRISKKEKERNTLVLDNAMSPSALGGEVITELNMIGAANAWWEQIGARIYAQARGFAARALGRHELVQLAEQLRALGPEDLARRYYYYQGMTEARIIESGYNLWNFVNNLDRIGVEVSRSTKAVGVRAQAVDKATEALLRTFNANFVS